MAKQRLALAAANGDTEARRDFTALEDEAAEKRLEIEILTLAAEAVDEVRAEDERRAEAERQAAATKRREAIISLREVEARADIERTIERFRRQGNHAQAEIWQRELAKLRQRLEAEVA